MDTQSIKKHIVRRSEEKVSAKLDDTLSPLLKRVYAARGVKDPQELERGLNALLPFQDLLHIDKAVDCLAQAVSTQRSILIIGDFDADGATSTALAVAALRVMGAQNVNFLVPNRFDYGYGLTPEIVALAKQFTPDVIITVDNGIASLEGALAAQAQNIQLVVTDHHLPGDQLPVATAIVNPQQRGDEFKSKNLAGVGVIFYVMGALRTRLRELGWFTQQAIAEPNIAQFLDLVALGTVADLVPLDHNNRILVHQGVQRIRAGKTRAGILALLKVAGRQAERLQAADLGYSVAPRLNAAGRLQDMSLGIECLLCEDVNRAYELATQLSVLNEERKLIEQEMQQQAFAILNQLKKQNVLQKQSDAAICLFDANWHQGVIGLLATRVKDYFHRPVIAFAPGTNADELKGSARSIAGVHIRDVLADVNAHHPHLITKFGGHAMAAGLSISKNNYEAFCRAFVAEVARHLNSQTLRAEIMSDGELSREDFTVETAELIRDAGPWGQAFPEPIFDGYFKILQQWIVGNKHLKLTVMPQGINQSLEAIAFNINVDHWPNHRADLVHMAYRLSVNEYLGKRQLQLIVEHIEAVGELCAVQE